MKKYYKMDHYRSKDKKYDIFVNWYTTKAGFLKFSIEAYDNNLYNGFCVQIAKYNTSNNQLLQWLRRNEYFCLMEN